MRITKLEIYSLLLPLKRQIKHASHTRTESENLLVRCTLADGTEGWGEGVPREYVTGESVVGAIEQLRASSLDEQLSADWISWNDVIAACDSVQLHGSDADPRGCHGNAARCAVELSLLDGFGKVFGEPVSRVTAQYDAALPIRARMPSVRYSGAITAESPRKERRSALKMRLYGFAQCKLKVGLEDVDEAARLKRIRRWLGRRIDLRLDANEAWKPESLVETVEPLKQFNITALEQPVPHEMVDELAAVRSKLGVPIMLDESLTSASDAEQAIEHGTCDLFNIRLSKCGGFLASLKLAAMADAAGLGYQLGCHPGESGILSAAGRHFASSVANIRYLEGSYDRHVLRRQLTREDITFGYGGWAPALPKPGLGVTVDQEALSEMATLRETIELQ